MRYIHAGLRLIIAKCSVGGSEESYFRGKIETVLAFFLRVKHL